MFKPSVKPQVETAGSHLGRRPFEGVDLCEAGRRGGQASGISRRLRKQRELEQKVLDSRNGAAAVKLLEIRMRRERDLERAVIEADRTVMWLMDQSDAERATIARLKERRRDYESAVSERIATLEAREASLEEREALLREAVAAGKSELVDRLRELHQDGGLVPVLEALDLLEAVPDHETGGDAIQAAVSRTRASSFPSRWRV